MPFNISIDESYDTGTQKMNPKIIDNKKKQSTDSLTCAQQLEEGLQLLKPYLTKWIQF